MNDFFHSRSFKVIILVIILLFAGMLVAASTVSKASAATSGLGFIITPLQNISSGISGFFTGIGDYFVSSKTYSEEMARLNEQLDNANKKLIDYEKAIRENEEYKKYLDLKEENPDFVFRAAEITAFDPANAFYSFTINQGSIHGIDVNDTVISGEYLVGVIYKVYPTSAVVITILDPKMSFGVYEVQSRTSSYATSTLELSRDGLCKMSNLDVATTVAPGGRVNTSGAGGIYPRDLMVGEVTEIRNDEQSISAYAVIKPGADIKSLRDVFVITSFNGKGINDSDAEEVSQ